MVTSKSSLGEFNCRLTLCQNFDPWQGVLSIVDSIITLPSVWLIDDWVLGIGIGGW